MTQQNEVLELIKHLLSDVAKEAERIKQQLEAVREQLAKEQHDATETSGPGDN